MRRDSDTQGPTTRGDSSLLRGTRPISAACIVAALVSILPMQPATAAAAPLCVELARSLRDDRDTLETAARHLVPLVAQIAHSDRSDPALLAEAKRLWQIFSNANDSGNETARAGEEDGCLRAATQGNFTFAFQLRKWYAATRRAFDDLADAAGPDE
jgi:hypothetical protein